MGRTLMARKNKQNTRGAAIAQAIIEEYQPQTREEMQNAIKDIFGPMFEAMRRNRFPPGIWKQRAWGKEYDEQAEWLFP